MPEHFSWMRSGTFLFSFRQSSCACSRKKRSGESARTGRVPSMSALSAPRIKISRRKSNPAVFGRTYTTACESSPSTSLRSGRGGTTWCCSWTISSRNTVGRSRTTGSFFATCPGIILLLSLARQCPGTPERDPEVHHFVRRREACSRRASLAQAQSPPPGLRRLSLQFFRGQGGFRAALPQPSAVAHQFQQGQDRRGNRAVETGFVQAAEKIQDRGFAGFQELVAPSFFAGFLLNFTG